MTTRETVESIGNGSNLTNGIIRIVAGGLLIAAATGAWGGVWQSSIKLGQHEVRLAEHDRRLDKQDARITANHNLLSLGALGHGR